MEERRTGDGDPDRPPYMFSELTLRFCQKSLGDVVVSAGDDWNGDESVLSASFYGTHVRDVVPNQLLSVI
jgi:hypothetical protein